MVKHILYLPRVNALEPIEKLFYGGAGPEILEEGRYRHTSPAKYPSPTDLVRVAFNCGAFVPAGHWVTSLPFRACIMSSPTPSGPAPTKGITVRISAQP